MGVNEYDLNLCWVTLSHVSFGIFVNEYATVIQAPPLFKWMQGKPFSVADLWISKHKGRIELLNE